MKEKITAPASSAGLIRFYDVKTSNIQLEPTLVVGFAVAIIVLEILFQIV